MTSPPPPLASNFPIIEPGGSLLLAWQLRDKRVLIVGGGEVASGRLRAVLEADALVTLISPSTRLHPEVRYRIFSDPHASPRITYHDRTYIPEDIDGIDFVLTAIDDVSASREICQQARERRIPVNVADVPPECDFYFGSQIRNGPLQILFSTNGKGPKIANIIRRRVEESIPPGVGDAITKVGQLRERLRERAPGVGGSLGRRRMKWMIGICEAWSLEELAELDDEMMEKLLDDGWEKDGRVLSFASVGGVRAVTRGWFEQAVDSFTVSSALNILVGVGIGVAGSYAVYRRSL